MSTTVFPQQPASPAAPDVRELPPTTRAEVHLDPDRARRIAAELEDRGSALAAPTVSGCGALNLAPTCAARDFFHALTAATEAVAERTHAIQAYTRALVEVSFTAIDTYERAEEAHAAALEDTMGGVG